MSLPNIITARADCNHTAFHVDTIGVHSLKWWKDAINAIRRTLADPVRDCQRRYCPFGTVWDIHHPTERTWLLLIHFQLQGRPFSVHRIDIARDERMDDTDQLGGHMEDLFDCLKFKRGRGRRVRAEDNALNFYLKSGRRKICRREICCYRRLAQFKPVKHTLVVRTELRFYCADAVNKAGISDLYQLQHMLLKAVFDRLVGMREYA